MSEEKTERQMWLATIEEWWRLDDVRWVCQSEENSQHMHDDDDDADDNRKKFSSLLCIQCYRIHSIPEMYDSICSFIK